MKNIDNLSIEMFKTSLNLITNRIGETLDLLESTTIVSNISNSSKLINFKNDIRLIKKDIIKIFKNTKLTEDKLTRFSLVVYHNIMSLLEYLKSNSKNEILFNNTSDKALKLDDEHIKKIKSYVKSLQFCLDKVNS